MRRWAMSSRSGSSRPRFAQRGRTHRRLARPFGARVPDATTAKSGQVETTRKCSGPFWRDARAADAERRIEIVRSPTPGPAVFVRCVVRRCCGNRSPAPRSMCGIVARGILRKPGPTQAEMNLRGSFVTDDGGTSIPQRQARRLPDPDRGPTGDLLRAQGRHNMRPAHLHFLHQGRLQDPDLADLVAGRRSSTPTCSSASRAADRQ